MSGLGSDEVDFERSVARQVLELILGDDIHVPNIATGRQRFEPLSMQHEHHAFFHPVVIVGRDVETVLAAGHADRVAKIGVMRPMHRRISEFCELRLAPIASKQVLENIRPYLVSSII
jgi:hypothetical protein